MCEKCAEAKKLLNEKFGDELSEYLLWNQTCFPMCGDTVLQQAKELVEKTTVEQAEGIRAADITHMDRVLAWACGPRLVRN